MPRSHASPGLLESHRLAHGRARHDNGTHGRHVEAFADDVTRDDNLRFARQQPLKNIRSLPRSHLAREDFGCDTVFPKALHNGFAMHPIHGEAGSRQVVSVLAILIRQRADDDAHSFGRAPLIKIVAVLPNAA